MPERQRTRAGVPIPPASLEKAVIDPVVEIARLAGVTRHRTKGSDLAEQRHAEAGAEGIPVMPDAFMLPYDAVVADYRDNKALDRAQRAIDSLTSTAGLPFKLTQGGQFIEILRNATSVMRAGATVITGLAGPVIEPKQVSASAPTWVVENSGSDLSPTTWTTSSSVAMAFKTVNGALQVTRQALFSAMSGNYDLAAIIRRDLNATIALAIDLAGLNGPGTANQPLGLLANTNVTTFALGANGANLSLQNLADMELALANQKADSAASMGVVTSPDARRKARVTQKFAGAGVAIWDDNNEMISYPAYSSQQVPVNYTKGTNTGVCSGFVFGAFEHLHIGFFGPGIEVVVDPYRLKNQNLIEILVRGFCDVALAQSTAFQVAKDLLTT